MGCQQMARLDGGPEWPAGVPAASQEILSSPETRSESPRSAGCLQPPVAPSSGNSLKLRPDSFGDDIGASGEVGALSLMANVQHVDAAATDRVENLVRVVQSLANRFGEVPVFVGQSVLLRGPGKLADGSADPEIPPAGIV